MPLMTIVQNDKSEESNLALHNEKEDSDELKKIRAQIVDAERELEKVETLQELRDIRRQIRIIEKTCDQYLGTSGKFVQLPNGKIYELNLDNIDYKQQREEFIKCMTE